MDPQHPELVSADRYGLYLRYPSCNSIPALPLTHFACLTFGYTHALLRVPLAPSSMYVAHA